MQCTPTESGHRSSWSCWVGRCCSPRNWMVCMSMLHFISKSYILSYFYSPTEESHASSFICQQPYLNVGQVSILRCNGFFSIQEIEIILKKVLEILREDDCKLWFNLTIHAFDDHPSTGGLFTFKWLIYSISYIYLNFIIGSNISSIFATPSDELHLYTLRSPTNKIK